MHALSYILCDYCFDTKYYYAGTQDSSSANQGLGAVIGSVLGALMIAAAATTIAVLAVLCFNKGTIIIL